MSGRRERLPKTGLETRLFRESMLFAALVDGEIRLNTALERMKEGKRDAEAEEEV